MSTPPAWMNSALCAQTDPEDHFPEKGRSPSVAKEICAECPVREQCLQWALENDERYGVWGGLTEAERRALKGGKKHHGRTHCAHGHEFTRENTSIDSRGRRVCKRCERERMRASRAKKRAAKEAAA